MTKKVTEQIYKHRLVLIDRLLEEVNTKEEYDDLLKEKGEIEMELKKIERPICPYCKHKNKVKKLSDGTIICNNSKCMKMNIPEKVKGGKRR
jgi:DNA gyrase/topoisomerase IV subunit A